MKVHEQITPDNFCVKHIDLGGEVFDDDIVKWAEKNSFETIHKVLEELDM